MGPALFPDGRIPVGTRPPGMYSLVVAQGWRMPGRARLRRESERQSPG